METMRVPNVMINRIARERLALDKMYGVLSTDHAVQMNTEKLHQALGNNFADFPRYIQTLATEGIIVRDSQWQKGFRRGRISYWKLGYAKEEAFNKLDLIHSREIAKVNEPPAPKNSVRNRILRALEEKGSFASAIELCDYINKNGGSYVQPHQATHILHNIQEQTGTLSFEKTKVMRPNRKGLRKNDKTVVVNIVWRGKNGKTIESVEAQIDDPEPMLISPAPAETPTVEFPLIKAFAIKRTKLSELADAVADAGEEDVAIMLMERAEIKDPFMLEVIALYSAYKECKGAGND